MRLPDGTWVPLISKQKTCLAGTYFRYFYLRNYNVKLFELSYRDGLVSYQSENTERQKERKTKDPLINFVDEQKNYIQLKSDIPKRAPAHFSASEIWPKNEGGA